MIKRSFIAKLSLVALSSLALFGCTKTDTASSDGSTSDNSSISTVDYVAEAHLQTEYAGKQFLNDGIGQVTLKEKVDGDTAHFTQVSGSTLTIKGRYNCIDTPESTGMVEPWGHGASEFNGSMLASAKTIVISTDLIAAKAAGKAPLVDSTGSRYLIYVWVSTEENAPISSLKLVNLALCQNGWSKAKGATKTDYADEFQKAATQAQLLKLHVWSDEKDSEYNYADPVVVTMQDIVDGVGPDGKAFDWTGAKATFTGIVAATGPDKGAAFVNKDFQVTENGATTTRRYGLYIFTSYIEFAPLATIGNEVQITGLVAEYEGVKQIVSVSYNAYYPEEGDMKILSKGNVLDPLTGTAAELAVDANIDVIVTATLTCTGGYATQNAATSTAYSFSLYCKDEEGTSLNIYIVDSIAIMDPSTGSRVQTVDYFKSAASLTVTGGLVTYTTSKGVKTYQIKLCSAKGLVVNS
jgi:endonuclease YncB( thermonuclease family)